MHAFVSGAAPHDVGCDAGACGQAAEHTRATPVHFRNDGASDNVRESMAVNVSTLFAQLRQNPLDSNLLDALRAGTSR